MVHIYFTHILGKGINEKNRKRGYAYCGIDKGRSTGKGEGKEGLNRMSCSDLERPDWVQSSLSRSTAAPEPAGQW